MLNLAELAVGNPWFADFAAEVSIDARLMLEAAKLKGEPIVYDAMQFDILLSDVAKLLDRIYAYRREYNDLVASATKQALEYDLSRRQKDTLLELEIAGWNLSTARYDAEQQSKVAASFKDVAESPLARGFSVAASAAEAVRRHSIAAEQRRLALVREKWDQLATYQDKLQSRHTQPGHALNFAERAKRVSDLLIQDFIVALRKTKSIYEGVNSVFSYREHFDQLLTDGDPLSSFVTNVRRLMRSIEVDTQFEVDIYGRIPMSAASLTQPNAGMGMMFVGSPWLAAFTTGRVRGLRIRSVGAYIRANDPVHFTAIRDAHTTAWVLLPGRQIMTLNHVTTRAPDDGGQWYSDVGLRNVNPFAQFPATNLMAGCFGFENCPADKINSIFVEFRFALVGTYN